MTAIDIVEALRMERQVLTEGIERNQELVSSIDTLLRAYGGESKPVERHSSVTVAPSRKRFTVRPTGANGGGNVGLAQAVREYTDTLRRPFTVREVNEKLNGRFEKDRVNQYLYGSSRFIRVGWGRYANRDK